MSRRPAVGPPVVAGRPSGTALVPVAGLLRTRPRPAGAGPGRRPGGVRPSSTAGPWTGPTMVHHTTRSGRREDDEERICGP
ncbi:hypothetical protein ACFFX0_29430 [Citricoccus parietis]|uniref:Uncharacterized protein n=1 Tax=Citricoccus parietis TaxID=592307 RepID=A0ABV5G868_9MICC